MDLIKYPASPSVGDSPFFLLLGFSGFYWGPLWGFSLGFISSQKGQQQILEPS